MLSPFTCSPRTSGLKQDWRGRTYYDVRLADGTYIRKYIRLPPGQTSLPGVPNAD